MSNPAARDEEQLARLIEIAERIAREGKAVPLEVREQIAYYERRVAVIEGAAWLPNSRFRRRRKKRGAKE